MLTTPWTSLVSPGNPLPEYPRPQLTRRDWLNLNGIWQYAPARSLVNPPIGRELHSRILVPYPIPSALSGIARTNRYMWYRRTVQIPQQWEGRRIQLNFGAVNWQADVWINGQLAGRHRGAYDAFAFDITQALHQGDNEIIVGVYSPLERGGIPLGKQRFRPESIFYTGSSGIWQTVWLEPTPAAHVVRLETTPDVAAGKLRLVVRSAGFFAQHVHVLVFAGGAQVADVNGSPNEIIHVPIPNAHLWSTEDPFLYDLRVTLSGPGSSDTVDGYFGMRSISKGFVNGVLRPLLNGEFAFQLGLLDQGYWPDGLYTAPTDDALRFDLQQHKNLGFNTVRKHMKVEPARWYYWADRLGLLVWQDMPALPVSLPNPPVAPSMPSDAARQNFEDELRRIVEQLRGFTSIVQWQPFNESWGAYDRARIASLVKSWDPTRLVDVDSGGWSTLADGSDRIDSPPVGDCQDEWALGHIYPGPDNDDLGPGGTQQRPPPPSPTRVAVLGEFGASGRIVSGHTWVPDWGFTVTGCKIYPDQATLTQQYVKQVDRVRDMVVSRGLSGAIYTELTDVEGEVDGLWTYDRKVLKVDAEQVIWANLTARTAAAADRSQQHVFYRGATDSAINHIFYDAAMRGLYFDQWTAKAHAPAAVGNPATMVWPHQQHVFYRGDGGEIHHIFWDGPTSRHYSDRWRPHPHVPQAPAAEGDPVTLVWPQQQHVFYRGEHGTINHIFCDVPASQLYFDQWQPNRHVPDAPPAEGNPATIVWPNQQHVFYRGPQGTINHIFSDVPNNHLHFDQWRPNQHVPDAPPTEGDPATLIWTNQQHVFYRGPQGTINHIFCDVPNNHLYFDQWRPNQHVPDAPPAAGNPVTMAWPNQQHVFYRGANGEINHIFCDVPNNRLYFDQWQPNSEVPSAPPAADDPVTLVTATQQHVFYRGLDGAINHIFWDVPTNRLYFDQWTARTQAPMAAGAPSTMFTS
jgi:hypothetical protein